MSTLFESLTLGDLTLPNRVIMAPLTRCRASAGRVPNDLMREYYTQRASAGLIFSEATAISAQGVGYPDTPGIWSEDQTEGWRKITDSVHAAGGRIVCQLWHVGRISHPFYLNGDLPVSASDVAPLGLVRVQNYEQAAYVAPRPLKTEEIAGVIETYRIGAENAKRAGFDGVEIHGANGYLPDQFLRDGTNHRTDEYGGTVENRARFLLQVTDAAIGVWGAGRVGVHLSPRNMDGSGAIDSDPSGTFGYVAEKLGERGIAYIFSREAFSGERITDRMKKRFGGAVIVNEGVTDEDAIMALSSGNADAVSWGKAFIANPDLPRRIETGAPRNEPNGSTFYGGGAEG
ncbi:MAG: alkene reductase, partial [Armatimonadetes bacterium]|nr:alkene reductase [Armatimonadota bacterium]